MPYLMRFTGVIVAGCVLAGCATTAGKSTSPRRLSRIEMGMPIRNATRAMHAKGVPVFACMEDGAAYRCVAVFVPETGREFYLLERDGVLVDAVEGDCTGAIASVPSDVMEGRLPHEDGFDTLLSIFIEQANPFEESNLEARKEGYTPSDYHGELGEYVMWAPIAILFLPATLPALAWGEMQTVRAFGLQLGDTPGDVRHRVGPPSEVLGNIAHYGVWVVRDVIVDADHVKTTVSVGFRDQNVVWIRYGFDASANGPPKDPEN